MAIEIVTPPAQLAISLSLVKEHLRIIGADDDTALTSLYIPGAISIFEKITRTALITQTIKETFDSFPVNSSYFLLEKGKPLQSVTHVKYYNTLGDLVTFDPANYLISSSSFPAAICLNTNRAWPSDIHKTRLGAVEVTYVSGFGAADTNVPAEIKPILSLIVGDLYRHREDSYIQSGIAQIEALWASSRLMTPYKTFYYQLAGQTRKLER